jgi:hypothetical protein
LRAFIIPAQCRVLAGDPYREHADAAEGRRLAPRRNGRSWSIRSCFGCLAPLPSGHVFVPDLAASLVAARLNRAAIPILLRSSQAAAEVPGGFRISRSLLPEIGL